MGGPQIIELGWVETSRLHEWLNQPNGSLTLPGVTFELVEGGGIMIRSHDPEAGTPWR